MSMITCVLFLHLFQLLPGVKVSIANPDTKGQCADSHLGEVTTVLDTKIYMNLNATKCTFGHADITSRKQQNNTVFVILEHWATK